ncbi:hypothetical protein Ancab_027944 [Ancistrocladus abbreviatus]
MEPWPKTRFLVPGIPLGFQLICLGASAEKSNSGPRPNPVGPEVSTPLMSEVPATPSMVVGSAEAFEAHDCPSRPTGLPTGTQFSDRRDRVCSQERHSPSSCRDAQRSSCLPVADGSKGPTSLLIKLAKCNHGLSIRRGKFTRCHYRKALVGSKNLVTRLMCSQISGTSIGDSSIQNRNRVLLLQQELTTEGVWEVGKWLEAAFVGEEAEVLARIRSLEERDKARGGHQ